MRAKRQKCGFLLPEVIYMGYAVNEFGDYPDKAKVEALLNAPEPDNVSKLKSYLGMLNYYTQFIPQAATLLEPFHRLLRSGEKWSWGAEQKEVFQKTKKLLCSAPVLAAAYHHSPSATDRKKITALTRAGVRTVMLAPPLTPTSPLFLKFKLQPLSVIGLSSCYTSTVLSAVTLLALSFLLFF